MYKLLNLYLRGFADNMLVLKLEVLLHRTLYQVLEKVLKCGLSSKRFRCAADAAGFSSLWTVSGSQQPSSPTKTGTPAGVPGGAAVTSSCGAAGSGPGPGLLGMKFRIKLNLLIFFKLIS